MARRLPDIRELEASSPDRDAMRARSRAAAFVVSVAAIALVVPAAVTVWEWRAQTGAPVALHAGLAFALVAGAVAILVVVARREGLGLLIMVAFLTPVVAWLLALALMFFAALIG